MLLVALPSLIATIDGGFLSMAGELIQTICVNKFLNQLVSE
jgi:hypothetical protein